MKKIPEDYLARQARIVRDRMRSHLRNRRGRTISREVSLAKLLGRAVFNLPEYCTFFTSHINECLASIREIRHLLEKGDKLLLDFSKTKHITALYAVYFYSELQSLSSRYGVGALRINIQSLSPELRFLVRESGILALVNGDESKIGLRRMLPILYGQKDESIDLIIDFIIKVAVSEGHLPDDPVSMAEAESKTFRAIQEAMLNVDYHAYDDPVEEKTWWFTAVIINSVLHIAICDRGVGIPSTLPRRDWWELAKKLFNIQDDAQMIQAAMQYTRTSSSSKDGRGLGTKDMQNLIMSEEEGRLTIVSGRGHYVLEGSDGKESIFNFSIPIEGTAINWKIPLGKKNA